jgi:hypothetical protein
MPDLETREQALAYLATMSPTETFQVHPFQHGWVCTTVMSQDQINSGEAVGAARLVIDSETGTIYQYPSWPTTMVAEAHTTFKATGVNRAARQIYPYQWRITARRIREDEETIVYRLTAESLIEHPEPTQEHLLTIEKRTSAYDPRNFATRVAMSHMRWLSRQQRGQWPEMDTVQI